MLDNNTIQYLLRLSKYDGDPYEDLKQSLIESGMSEVDATHEMALYMNTIADLMD